MGRLVYWTNLREVINTIGCTGLYNAAADWASPWSDRAGGGTRRCAYRRRAHIHSPRQAGGQRHGWRIRGRGLARKRCHDCSSGSCMLRRTQNPIAFHHPPERLHDCTAGLLHAWLAVDCSLLLFDRMWTPPCDSLHVRASPPGGVHVRKNRYKKGPHRPHAARHGAGAGRRGQGAVKPSRRT